MESASPGLPWRVFAVTLATPRPLKIQECLVPVYPSPSCLDEVPAPLMPDTRHSKTPEAGGARGPRAGGWCLLVCCEHPCLSPAVVNTWVQLGWGQRWMVPGQVRAVLGGRCPHIQSSCPHVESQHEARSL